MAEPTTGPLPALEALDRLEADWHVDALIPALLELAWDARKALDDGRISLPEAWRLGRKLLRLVAAARK